METEEKAKTKEAAKEAAMGLEAMTMVAVIAQEAKVVATAGEAKTANEAMMVEEAATSQEELKSSAELAMEKKKSKVSIIDIIILRDWTCTLFAIQSIDTSKKYSLEEIYGFRMRPRKDRKRIEKGRMKDSSLAIQSRFPALLPILHGPCVDFRMC